MEVLIWYFHAATGFPVRNTWLKPIKAGNFTSWPGFTYQSSEKSCAITDETLKGHMVQVRQGIRYTKPKPQSKQTPDTSLPIYTKASHAIHIRVKHIRKPYTDDTGHFPVRSKSGIQYIIISYHCYSNASITAPFKYLSDKNRLLAYGAIMQRLKYCNMLVELQILDNEAITEYKRIIKAEWGVQYQLVPPHIHRRNADEHAIRTFKARFIFILAGIAKTFPNNLWDLLIHQTYLTLNILRQSTLNPKILAWEYFHGPFDYKATPLETLGCPVMIHRKTSSKKS